MNPPMDFERTKSGEVLSAYYRWDGVGRANAKLRVDSGEGARKGSVVKVGWDGECECKYASKFWGKERTRLACHSGEKRPCIGGRGGEKTIPGCWPQTYFLEKAPDVH